MSASVIAHRNAKLAAFRALFETLLGVDLLNTIGGMVGELTTRIQAEPLDEEHTLVLSHPVPSLTNQTRLRVQVLWVNAFRNTTYLVCTYIPDEPYRTQLVYNTGHGFSICVSSIRAHIMVNTLPDVTNFFNGNMHVGEFRRVVVRDGFEVCLSRARF
jgi:hypothetical protein